MSDFIKPINLINLFVGIIGIAFGYYFYKLSQPSVSLHYFINKEQIANLDRDEYGITKDGKDLGIRSLYKTTVGIWNAGTVPLDRSLVRRPLIIELSKEGSIISASIEKISNNVANFGLVNSSKGVQVNWTYFDPHFAALVVLYHSSDEVPQVSLRYVGDENIASRVAARLADAPNFFIAVGLGIFVCLIAFPLFIWISILMDDWLKKKGIEEINVIGLRFPIPVLSSFLGGGLIFAMSLLMFDSKFGADLGRRVLGIDVPTVLQSGLQIK